MSDPRRAAEVLVTVGVAITAAAAVVAFVFFLQPWRTCPDDDTPTGCPALPEDAAVLTVALVVMLVTPVLTVVGRGVWSNLRPGGPFVTVEGPTREDST